MPRLLGGVPLLPPSLSLAAAVIALSGCSDSSGSNSGPPDEQLVAVGTTTRDEVESSLNGLTAASAITPLGGSPSTACVSPSSSTDTDGDGIPDDATWIFTSPPCHFSGFRSGTLDVVGQLRLVDPSPDAAGFGAEATLTALRYTFVTDNKTYSETRNGSRTLTGSTAGLQLATDLQLARTFTGQPDAAVDEQWTVAFAPEQQIQINQPLPSGTLDVSGTFEWTRGSESLALTITTPTPLHYNATCEGIRRLDAGELRANGTFNDTPGYVRIRWTGCNKDPEIRFVAG